MDPITRKNSQSNEIQVSHGTNRRTVLGTLAGAAAGIILSPFARFSSLAQAGTTPELVVARMAPKASATYPFSLPTLPYAHDALGAAIDAETMQIHHGKHHAGYTNKLNAALESHSMLHDRPLAQMLIHLDELPKEVRTAVRNNGGGYLNHALFWEMMSPNGGGMPKGSLAEAVDRDFGSFAKFKKEFEGNAGGEFGSGWGWLVTDGEGKLELLQTPNQDTPMLAHRKPVIGVDVWEHAYYLRYQNKRGDYLSNFWNVVNWDQALINYEA